MYVLAKSNCLIKCQLSKLNIMKNRRHCKCCGSRLSISSEKYFYSVCAVVFLLQLCTDDTVETLCPETSNLSVRSQEGTYSYFQKH